MKYLLLNGTKTSNLNDYLRDVLFLNFKTLPSEIPFNNDIGMTKYILEDDQLSYTDKVREEVLNLLGRLNDRYQINLKLLDLTLNKNIVKINISLDRRTNVDFELEPLL